MKHRAFHILSVGSILILAGCSPALQAAPTLAPTAAAPTSTPAPTARPEPTPAPFTVEDITLTTEDGVALAGNLYDGGGGTAVILAHTADGAQEDWKDFAEHIAARGYVALTFNFRGRPPSEGSPNLGQISLDTNAAVAYLRGLGYSQIVCMGGSAGGTACMRTAVDKGMAGIVIISSPQSIGGATRLGLNDIPALTMPKLFVAAENDVPFVGGMQTLYQVAPDPKQIEILPGEAHGTRLFLDPAAADRFTTLLLGFLDALPPAAAPSGQMFSSKLFDYSIRYPEGWLVKERAGEWYAFEPLDPNITAGIDVFAAYLDGRNLVLGIGARPLAEDIDLEAWIEIAKGQIRNTANEGVCREDSENDPELVGTITLDGAPAVLLAYTCPQPYDHFGLVALSVHDGKGYWITWLSPQDRIEEDKAEFIRILSTFAFVE